MKNDELDQLISRLEVMAKDHPARYGFYVISVVLLGFAILGVALFSSLLAVALLVGLSLLVIATGGKALILVATLGKLLILLALPAWVMIRSSFSLLFARLPSPRGRELQQDEAPALFVHLNDIRKQMKGPCIHHVLLTDELNAAIVQHPRFGLLGWEKNYLILGLPLLQALNEEEALAVVAHEYGHLSGHHGRLGGFIYRFRSTWGRLQSLSEQWNDWGSRLIARLFRWYAPYFNAYTFVFARQNEYVADRCSVEIFGQHTAASALMKLNVASLFENEKFWPSIERRAVDEPEPVKKRSALWREALQSELDPETRSRYVETAGRRKTDHFDTHPALNERLSAIGLSVTNLDSQHLAVPAVSAAMNWLGNHLESIQSEFDHAWEETVSAQWRERHAYLKERKERLAALDAQVSLTTDEQWEYITLLGELSQKDDLLPRLNALITERPEHLSALYRRGVLLLEKGDEAGMEDLESVMQKDQAAILPVCEAAWRYYLDRSPEKAEHYRTRWQERTGYVERVQAELATLPPNAKIAPAGVDETVLEDIRAVLRTQEEHVALAYLFQRVLESDPAVKDFVLGVEPSFLMMGDNGREVIKGLSEQQFPFPVFIVDLKHKPYNEFSKHIKRLNITPFYSGGN
ncbi:MAG: M48 family metalloprotease [Pseudomonadota bacterium]